MSSRTNSGMPPKSVATIARPWLAASISALGSPSRSPDCGLLDRQDEQVSFAQQRDDIGLRFRTEESDLAGDAVRLCPRLQAAEKLATADMGKAPVQSVGQGGQGLKKIVVALLGDRPPDGHDAQRIRRV